MSIEHPEKIGIGLWEGGLSPGTALDALDAVGFSWHYTWLPQPLRDDDTAPEITRFVPQIWGRTNVNSGELAEAKASKSGILMAFNEPDHPSQSNMTVSEALNLWPHLQATGMRLGSPAVTPAGALGANSWLGRFMAGAEQRGLDVDFIQVHHYSTSTSVAGLKAFLEKVYAQYGKPIWLTEWALADWSNPGRFSAEQQAAYARAGAEMLDDLSFVERHAWFAGFEGGDGWHLNSGVFYSDGTLTSVGRVFDELLPDVAPTGGTMIGTAANDRLAGTTGANSLHGLGGNDTFIVNDPGDEVIEHAGAGTDTIQSSVGYMLPANVEVLRLIGLLDISGHGNDVANRIIGNPGVNWIMGRGGNDRMDGAAGNDHLYGQGGSDTFVFRDGVDRIYDFANDADTVAVDNALWGATAKTVTQVLAQFGRAVSGAFVLDFGTDELRIDGASAAALANDLEVI